MTDDKQPTVFLVFEDIMYEGSWLQSAWSTREAAEAEEARLVAADPGGWYRVQEVPLDTAHLRLGADGGER